MADDNECSARAVRLDRKVERNGGETQLCSILGDIPDGVCEHGECVIVVRVDLASDSVGSN